MTANGFSARCLRRRSSSTADARGGVAGQVVAAEALDGHDLARPPGRAGRRPGRASSLGSPAAGAASNAELRPARRAGDRLGVEAPVAGIVVLRRALAQSGKPAMVVLRPVVGQAKRDGEPGAAVGAVDERVAVAPVGRVEQLGQAVLAHRHVRRHERPARRCARLLDDPEARRSPTAATAGSTSVDAGQGWGLVDQAALEASATSPGRPRSRRRRRRCRCRRDRPSPSSVARRCTNGRNPTPWTTPATRIRCRTGRSRRRRGGHAGQGRFRPRVTAASRCIRPKL